MKKFCLIFLFLFLSLLFFSCIGDDYEDPPFYSSYEPILMKKSKLESSIYLAEARALKKTGKIYYKDGYIFISEKYEGIHIINNKDPKNPRNVGFINIPGCLDMAIKQDTITNENILYVDNASDLVALKLSADPKNFEVVKRVKDIIPELKPPDGQDLQDKFKASSRPSNTVIVNWREISNN